MSDRSTRGTGHRVGRCGNCDGWVWTDQQFVKWCGIVPIHSDCWDDETTDKTRPETDR